ncbi:HNH endonuclease [Ruania rhizosphaerae]|uniref:HNH endonuclease n=1 Tax=Ruania rhizosphaerae TaxID=1840413 RepID=UPI0013581FDF|nr:HNH endonuclease signature motif containing protein [Ruania rhizosphaerae]
MRSTAVAGEAGEAPGASVVLAAVRSTRSGLRSAATSTDLAALGNTERVDLLRELEELAGSVAAVQARLSADLDASIRAERAGVGIPPEQQGAAVAAQVALARRVSPVRGSQYLGMGKALVNEMPHTMAALAGGALSEWRATLLVRESACLSVEDRAAFDAELCADPERFAGWGDKRFVAEARALTNQLDQAALVRRAAKAEADRRVTIRPAPDVMAQVTAMVPVAQGVAVHAALTRRAQALRAQGDERSTAQLMADTLVERVTGQSRADGVPIQVHVVMSDRALLDQADEASYVNGYGTVPSRWARDLIARASEQAGEEQTGDAGGNQPATGPGSVDPVEDSGDEHQGSRLGAWIRRLFIRPESGELVAMQSRARRAPAGLAAFIRARDRTCRMPWCDAPIRHIDHVTEHAAGGSTSESNLQGLCEACNYAKSARGWSARAEHERRDSRSERPDDGDLPAVAACRSHRVRTTTPTGHVYSSQPPRVLGPPHPAGHPWWRRERDVRGPFTARERGPTTQGGIDDARVVDTAIWTSTDRHAAAYARELEEAYADAGDSTAMGAGRIRRAPLVA